MGFQDYIFKEGLFYDKNHGWARDDGGFVTLGVSDFFQKLANEIIFVELPLVGRVIEKDQPYSSIESGKWVGRLISPLSGEVMETNTELQDFPYLINEDPYGDGWIVKIKAQNKEELQQLYKLDDTFKSFIEDEEKRIEGEKGK